MIFRIFDSEMIGVYDSGVGGLSVWKELRAAMPAEDFCYVSDGAYCPYGPKDPAFVVDRAMAVSRFLISQGAEVVVVACNTATAAAISTLRSSFAIPFVGMEPALKPASPAELIYDRFQVSKKAYKKAIGDLYKRRLITIEEEGIRLA